MYKVQIDIEGISDILMHSMDPEQVIAAQKRQKGAKRESAFEGEPREWRDHLYWRDGVGLFVKADCFETCVRNAARSGRYKANKKSVGPLIASGFFCQTEANAMVLSKQESAQTKLLHKEGPEAFPASSWEDKGKRPDFVYVSVIRLKATGGRQCRYRACIKSGWTATIMCDVFHDEIAPELLQVILADAGQFQGLYDYRPKFGRFVVKRFAVLS